MGVVDVQHQRLQPALGLEQRLDGLFELHQALLGPQARHGRVVHRSVVHRHVRQQSQQRAGLLQRGAQPGVGRGLQQIVEATCECLRVDLTHSGRRLAKIVAQPVAQRMQRHGRVPLSTWRVKPGRCAKRAPQLRDEMALANARRTRDDDQPRIFPGLQRHKRLLQHGQFGATADQRQRRRQCGHGRGGLRRLRSEIVQPGRIPAARCGYALAPLRPGPRGAHVGHFLRQPTAMRDRPVEVVACVAIARAVGNRLQIRQHRAPDRVQFVAQARDARRRVAAAQQRFRDQAIQQRGPVSEHGAPGGPTETVAEDGGLRQDRPFVVRQQCPGMLQHQAQAAMARWQVLQVDGERIRVARQQRANLSHGQARNLRGGEFDQQGIALHGPAQRRYVRAVAARQGKREPRLRRTPLEQRQRVKRQQSWGVKRLAIQNRGHGRGIGQRQSTQWIDPFALQPQRRARRGKQFELRRVIHQRRHNIEQRRRVPQMLQIVENQQAGHVVHGLRYLFRLHGRGGHVERLRHGRQRSRPVVYLVQRDKAHVLPGLPLVDAGYLERKARLAAAARPDQREQPAAGV